jgi:hypothetical protein
MPCLQELLAAELDLTSNYIDLALRETIVDGNDRTIQADLDHLVVLSNVYVWPLARLIAVEVKAVATPPEHLGNSRRCDQPCCLPMT